MSDEPAVLHYDRENGFDALLELGCGGELEVLVEPLTSPDQIGFADIVRGCLEQRKHGMLATWFARDGRCLSPRRLVLSQGTVLLDTFDAPDLSAEVIACGETLASDIAAETRLIEIAGAHHERLDGKGYPRGIGAEHITLETRIITTADIFDAITAERPYRGATEPLKALAIMRESVGTALDPRCFEALERVVARLQAVDDPILLEGLPHAA